jgi:hypothetical protein
MTSVSIDGDMVLPPPPLLLLARGETSSRQKVMSAEAADVPFYMRYKY